MGELARGVKILKLLRLTLTVFLMGEGAGDVGKPTPNATSSVQKYLGGNVEFALAKSTWGQRPLPTQPARLEPLNLIAPAPLRSLV